MDRLKCFIQCLKGFLKRSVGAIAAPVSSVQDILLLVVVNLSATKPTIYRFVVSVSGARSAFFGARRALYQTRRVSGIDRMVKCASLKNAPVIMNKYAISGGIFASLLLLVR